jgi:hypothetical protein
MAKYCRMLFVWLVVFCMAPLFVEAQVRHEISFPDIPGYKTLKCDLHTHTVFSDGDVWPSVRAEEAWREGLDVVAISDHIEYQPHKEHVKHDHNASYQIAAEKARSLGVLVIKAAEITRGTPPGHYNALFLDDASELEVDAFVDAVRIANEQGHFVFWNHPLWKGIEKGRWQDIQQQLYDSGWLHGIEVANGSDYYPEVHEWCLEKNLTMVGNSDIHRPSMIEVSTADNHRPMTLVFASDVTPEAIRDALHAGRTAVWMEEKLIGKKQYIEAIFDGSVEVRPPHFRQKAGFYVHMINRSHMNIELKRMGDVGPEEIILEANATSVVQIKHPENDRPASLEYEVANFLIAPGKGLPVTLAIAGVRAGRTAVD